MLLFMMLVVVALVLACHWPDTDTIVALLLIPLIPLIWLLMYALIALRTLIDWRYPPHQYQVAPPPKQHNRHR